MNIRLFCANRVNPARAHWIEVDMNKVRSLPAVLLAAALLSPVTTHAAGPFTSLAGVWSGGGTLTMADGNTERLRCRADYDVSGAGTDLQLRLRCASSSYNFELGSDVVARGSRISGTWSEVSRNLSGPLTGRASADHVEASARGENFSAGLSLTTRGNRQSVSIRSQGGAIAGVSLALSRN
jgi:hypothetical protein